MAAHRRRGHLRTRGHSRTPGHLRTRHRPAGAAVVGVAAVSATLVVGAAGALYTVGSLAGGGVSPGESGGMPPRGEAAGVAGGQGTTVTQASRSNGRTTVITSPAGGTATTGGNSGGAAFGHARNAGTGMTQSAIPGLGPGMMSRVPVESRQVVVVTGDSSSSTTNLVTLWERHGPQDPWTQVGVSIPGRNGEDGWAVTHREGDSSSPVGVFTLTAAGGRLPDPGTGLPYEYQPSFYQAGDAGTPMAAAFDYVVAVDYNRLSGHPPSDPHRPLGEQAGGDIWLHIDHASPTRGCVTVPRETMETILHWLTPAAHPVVVMGDQARLSA